MANGYQDLIKQGVTSIMRNNKETLAYWIMEREHIRISKVHDDPAPWSDDSVFQTVYFTNVRREHDKVTKWIRANYTPEFFGANYELAIVAARIFNRPETLTRISNHLVMFNPPDLINELMDMQDEKQQVWSGAYLISTCGAKMPKSVYCGELLREASYILPLDGIDTCQRAYEVLTKINGIGSFLAAQIVADLKNTKGHRLQNALDKDTFAAPGPGSLRGLGWFFERKLTPTTFMDGLLQVRKYLEDSPARCIVLDICNQDLQNCLCEYSKYMKVKTGTGRSKRKYNGI